MMRPPIDDLPDFAKNIIEEFNARPMRRAEDAYVLGWDYIEVTPARKCQEDLTEP